MPHQVCEHVGEAGAVESGADRNLRFVDDQRTFDGGLELGYAALELPAIEAEIRRPAVVQAAVLMQFARRTRNAEALQIGGRGHRNHFQLLDELDPTHVLPDLFPEPSAGIKTRLTPVPPPAPPEPQTRRGDT